MTYSPTRPFLGMAAWKWLLVPLFVGILALTFPPPGPLLPPQFPVEMVEPAVWVELPLVRGAEQSLRLVHEGEQNKPGIHWKIKIVPVGQGTVEWQFGWIDNQFILGLYKRNFQWHYSLHFAPVYDDGQEEKYKPIEESAVELRSEATKIRQSLIADLNRRFPEKKLGNQLEELLANGREQTSYICVQNFLILLVWLSMLAALAALGSMVVPEEDRPNSEPAPSASEVNGPASHPEA